MLKTFRAFDESGRFRRRNLPFLKTLEDLDITRAIGLHQALGKPLAVSQLMAQGIASVASVQRRLSRLRRLGIVVQTRSDYDRRVVRLTLGPHARRLHEGWARHFLKTYR